MDSLLEPVAEIEKQQFCSEMMKRLDIQRRNEQFCDVILEVGSGVDQVRLKAHIIVLCAASPFFYNALNSDMKEKKEGVIRLEATNKAVMEDVLEYLYTGHVDINEENAYCLMAVADYFILPSLKALSANFIMQTLSLADCVKAYYFATKYQCEELQKSARDFILKNFVAVAETEDFLNLSSKEVEEWLASDEIIVEGEEKVFEVVVEWVEKNGCKKYQSFYDLFQHVRFIYVPRNYLSKVILPHRFVKDRKRCVDLVLGAMNCMSEGTEECFFSMSPRNCLKTYEDAIVACGPRKAICYIPSKNKWYLLCKMPSLYSPCYGSLSACHGKLYVLGGSSSHGSFLKHYDPLLNLWSPLHTPGTVYPRAAVVTFQGFLYAVGGRDKESKVVSSVQKYNPDTNIWQTVSPLSSPRSIVCAVADESFLYAIGGVDSTHAALDTVERFDPRNNSWDKLPPTLAKRSSASGVIVEQKLFIFGGMESVAGSTCEMYDPVTSVWSEIPSPVVPRVYASAVSFKGQIFVAGDFQRDHDDNHISLQVYNIDQTKWKLIGLLSTFYQLSLLRISRDVLAQCRVIADGGSH